MQRFSTKGFSIIELMLAGAVFVVFCWGVIEVLLSGLVTDRLNRETTIATNYAVGGLEAVRAIKDENFDDLVVTEGTGIGRENDFFVFSGGNDVMEEKYTRTVTIAPGKRDGDGNITEGDGDEDVDTKRVTVAVVWQASPTRNDSVILETYMTRWKTIPLPEPMPAPDTVPDPEVTP